MCSVVTLILVEDDFELTVVVMNDLKVFDRRLCDSAMEVEHIRLSVIVPHRCLVVQLYHALCAFVLPSSQQRLVFL